MKQRMNECNFLQNKLGNVTVINVLWYLFEAPGGADPNFSHLIRPCRKSFVEYSIRNRMLSLSFVNKVAAKYLHGFPRRDSRSCTTQICFYRYIKTHGNTRHSLKVGGCFIHVASDRGVCWKLSGMAASQARRDKGCMEQQENIRCVCWGGG